MQGGMVVVGLVTGGHVIQDLQIHVPHKVAVLIKADDMLRSRDLYRALSQNLLFKIDGGTGFPIDDAPAPTASRADSPAMQARIDQLEAENRDLKAKLLAAEAATAALQKVLQNLPAQMELIHSGLTRLEQKSPVVQVVSGGGPAVTATPGVIGGDVPTFLPDEIKPKDAVAEIRVAKQVSEGSSVGAAGDKLRELRKGKSGG